MSHDAPNRLVMNHGSSFIAHFGAPYAAGPMHHVSGLGHDEHILISCYGGLRLELTPEHAIWLARHLPEAVAALPIENDYSSGCSGAVADLGGE